ncbi:MAG: oligosaccharide flippase family protein [Clostridia bacterium]|nr:oligosaccharide flippase family protein [Clostridia bacterium]
MRTVSVSFNAYISSKIGAEGMGLISLCSSVYGFALTLATSGINLAVVRLVSRALPYESDSYFDKRADGRVHKTMKNALLYCLFFSALASLGLFFGADAISLRLLNERRTVSSLKLLSLTLCPISISSALNGYFCAVRRVYKNVITQILEQGVKIFTVSSLLVLIAPLGVEFACMAVVAGGALSESASLVCSAVLYFFDRKMHRRIEKREASNSKGTKISFFKQEAMQDSSILKIALPVALSAYLRSALLTIEHLAIPWGLKKSGASATSALSSYGVMHGMVFPLLLFPSAVLGAFSSLLIPELSSAQEQGDYARIRSIVSRVFCFSLLFSVGVSGIFVCFSSELGQLIYKNDEASEFIRLLSPLIPLMYLDGAVDSMLKGLGEQLYTMRVNIIDSLLSVVLVLLLLPRMGIYGYVTVIFLMELLNTALSIIRLLNITGVKAMVVKWVAKPLLCVILSTVITRLLFVSDRVYTLAVGLTGDGAVSIVQIVLSVILYALFSVLSGTVSKDEVALFKSALKG